MHQGCLSDRLAALVHAGLSQDARTRYRDVFHRVRDSLVETYDSAEWLMRVEAAAAGEGLWEARLLHYVQVLVLLAAATWGVQMCMGCHGHDREK